MTAPGPRGITEIRAILGRLFIGLGVAVLVLGTRQVYQMLGIMYLTVSVYRNQNVGRLAWVNTLTGWPATILLLVVSYLYGTWRLARLGGPSVEGFRNGALPPWQGQRRGF